MAVYTPSGTPTYYRHSDWLGSARLSSTPGNTVYAESAYGSFGEPYVQTGSDVSFTGMDQDTVSNLYDFPAREYGIQGRWPSPDPSGIAAVDPTDPQSWNRYAYVRNNPLAMIDPTGLDCAYINETTGSVDGIENTAQGAGCGGSIFPNDYGFYFPGTFAGQYSGNVGNGQGNYSFEYCPYQDVYTNTTSIGFDCTKICRMRISAMRLRLRRRRAAIRLLTLPIVVLGRL
jgi:RHS repeat-associated protein